MVVDIGTRSASWHSAMATPKSSSLWRERLKSCGSFRKYSANNFRVLSKAGVGSYSQVISAVDTMTGQSVAIKVFRPWSPSEDVAQIVDRIETAQPGRTPMVYSELVQTLVREASFVESAGKHPNIVNILGICIDAPAIIMEKAASDLYHVIAQRHQSLPLEAIYKWTWQIASGLDCIHRAGMIHLDIKSSNILISNELNAVICDFGNTCNCSYGSTFSPTKEVVTLWYRAPEIIMGSQRLDHRVDVWSLGAILLEMLIGRPAFQGDDSQRSRVNVNFNNDQLDKIFQVMGTPDMRTLENYQLFRLISSRHTRHPNVLRQLISAALRRRNFNGPLHKPEIWHGLLETMLDMSPRTRVSAGRVATRLAAASRLSFEINGLGKNGPAPSKYRPSSSSKSASRGLFARLPFASCTNSLNIAH